jgi:ribosomal protein S18 acetylase RimI-like enzyme
MTVRDFGAVYELGLRCYDVTDKPYNYWSIAEVADHLQNHPALCYVAEADGQVVGFVLGSDTFEIIEDTGHIEWVAVAPEARRQGLASRLLQTLVDEIAKMGRSSVVTDIAADNPYSRGLARKLGFSEGLTVTYFTKELG